MNIDQHDHVTAAWIARQVGVGRAAVANWRKRYPSFPQPVTGGANSPLFSWPAVRKWLIDTGKADQLASVGRTGTGTQLIGDAASVNVEDRDPAQPGTGSSELLARVLVSLLPRLNGGDRPSDDQDAPVVLDPACGDATVLAVVAERFGDHVQRTGQAPDESAAAAVRGALPGIGDDIRVGDALRIDRFAATRGSACAVLCVPPHTARQWPAAELAADPRWSFGLPDPADPELAWVQHCFSHLRPRGVAVIAMSPVTGARPSGRHVRAALVRAGVLRDVIALPAGLSRSGDDPLHLWVLERGAAARAVRMVDVSAIADVADVPSEYAAWEGVFATDDPSVVRTVPQLDLLDGETTLIPSRYLHARAEASADDLGRVAERLHRLYADLGSALPRPMAPHVVPRYPDVTLAELERSRAITILPRDATPRSGDLLFRTMGKEPVVAAGTSEDERSVAQVVGLDTARLDPHFVALFVRADALAAPVANTHSALTREDVRRCRVPRMPLSEQRHYGAAFRRLLEINAAAARLAVVTDAVVAQTAHSLTAGALSPSLLAHRETIAPETVAPETVENEKRTQ